MEQYPDGSQQAEDLLEFSHPGDEKIVVVLEKPLFLIIVRPHILVAG